MYGPAWLRRIPFVADLLHLLDYLAVDSAARLEAGSYFLPFRTAY
jgi:hypothetical protein